MCVKKIFKYFFIFTLLIFIVSLRVLAATKVFHVFEEKNLPNQLGMFRHIQFTLDNNIDIYATIFNANMRAMIFRQSANNPFYADNLSTLSRYHPFVVAINGGFYTRSYQPAGLFIEKGNRIRALAKDTLLTTCIRVDRTGRLSLEEYRENCLNAFYAMQTGPLLIEHGKVNQNINSLSEKLKKMNSFFSENRRTVLAEAEDHKIIALVSTPATLTEVAYILTQYPESFGVKKIKTALDLDGGSSTGMYVRFVKEPFYFYEQRHVKTFVFFY
jgi:exopolysaccharide biosynthesis protein